MKSAITGITLLICFTISILFTVSGIYIRINNESRNKSLVIVADYNEFLKAANDSKLNFDIILNRLKRNGVSAIALQSSNSGLDINALNKIKSMGFHIILRPDTFHEYSSGLIKEYDAAIKAFQVKYLIFAGPEDMGGQGNIDEFESIIRKNKLIIGIIENLSQTGYLRQSGLDKIILNTDYPVNRVYILPENDLENISSSEVFYRWLRCAVDRNIRFIYVRPLKNKELSSLDNLNNTFESVGEFNSFVPKAGFAINRRLDILSPKSPPWYHYYAVSFSLIFMFMLYIQYLFRPKTGTLVILGITGLSLAIIINLHLGNYMPNIWATFAANLYPSFSSLILLLYLRKSNSKPIITLVLSSLGILLGINAIGMYTVVTSLADIRFSMGIIVYSGVTISFILPVILFGINYFGSFVGFENTKEFFVRFTNSKITTRKILVFLFFSVVFYFYIVRSGNDLGIPASNLELKAREVLEKLLLVRPRFKEFLIGYPTLFIMIYLYNKYKKNIILLMLGTIVVMGSVSMVNSFCHVFTPCATSLQRTINGLAIGLPLGLLSIIAVRTLILFYNQSRINEIH